MVAEACALCAGSRPDTTLRVDSGPLKDIDISEQATPGALARLIEMHALTYARDFGAVDPHHAALAGHHVTWHPVDTLGKRRRDLPEMRSDEGCLRRGKHHEVTACRAAVLVDPEGPIGKRPRRVDENCMVVAPAGQRGTCRKRRRKRADHQPSPGVRGARGKRLS